MSGSSAKLIRVQHAIKKVLFINVGERWSSELVWSIPQLSSVAEWVGELEQDMIPVSDDVVE